MALTKKRTLAIIEILTAVFVVTLPLAAYALPADDNGIASTKNLTAKGVAKEDVNGETVTVPANFTLTLARAGGNKTVPRFNVEGGTVTVNGVVYTITSGNGGVLRGRRLFLLKAGGMSPDGQAVTLKLAGRYFWMGGRLYVARMGARLLTPNGNYTLLLRAGIRV